MKTFALMAALLAAATPALAEETHDWSGPYIGAHAGVMFADWDHSSTISSPSGHDGGGNWGGQAGYNLQSGPSVLGVEADLSSLSLDNDFVNFTDRHFKETWQSNVRARYGYAIGNWLPYADAGVAFTGIKASIAGVGNESDTAAGVMGGVGVDYAFTNSWSMRSEFNVTNVPTKEFHIAGTALQLGSTNETLNFGLNYSLGDLLK